MSPATPPKLVIKLLGHFEVERLGQVIAASEWQGQQTRDLLKILSLQRGHYVANDQLYEWLWPNTEREAAQTNLRAVVSDLRKILEPDLKRGRDSQFILTRHEGYEFALNANAILDLAEFERLTDSATRTDLEAALSLYRGDLLEEDRYAEWASTERTRLKTLYLKALVQLSERLWQESAYAQCIALCEKALVEEPTLEAVWRTLMQAQAASGNRAAALATFERCRATLSRELGVDPAPETVALHTSLLREEADTSKAVVLPSTKHSIPNRRWLNWLGGLGFIVWALITGIGFGLSLLGLITGTAVSPGDPGVFALPYLANHPHVLADIHNQLYLFFPTGWLLLAGYVAWFRLVQAKHPTLAWFGVIAGVVDAICQTLAQAIGLTQLAVLPNAYLGAVSSQQLTLITIWDLMRQFAAIAGTVSLVANFFALVLLLWASWPPSQFSRTMTGIGLAVVIGSAVYYGLPDGPWALVVGIGLVFGLRLWLMIWGIGLGRVKITPAN